MLESYLVVSASNAWRPIHTRDLLGEIMVLKRLSIRVPFILKLLHVFYVFPHPI